MNKEERVNLRDLMRRCYTTQPPWRVGTKVGRTIYNEANELMGVMDKVYDSLLIVTAVNALPALLDYVDKLEGEIRTWHARADSAHCDCGICMAELAGRDK